MAARSIPQGKQNETVNMQLSLIQINEHHNKQPTTLMMLTRDMITTVFI
jgi:hypothetical protein